MSKYVETIGIYWVSTNRANIVVILCRKSGGLNGNFVGFIGTSPVLFVLFDERLDWCNYVISGILVV